MEEGIVLKIEDNLSGLVGVDRFTSYLVKILHNQGRSIKRI